MGLSFLRLCEFVGFGDASGGESGPGENGSQGSAEELGLVVRGRFSAVDCCSGAIVWDGSCSHSC